MAFVHCSWSHQCDLDKPCICTHVGEQLNGFPTGNREPQLVLIKAGQTGGSRAQRAWPCLLKYFLPWKSRCPHHHVPLDLPLEPFIVFFSLCAAAVCAAHLQPGWGRGQLFHTYLHLQEWPRPREKSCLQEQSEDSQLGQGSPAPAPLFCRS